jgi:hypothetical protein
VNGATLRMVSWLLEHTRFHLESRLWTCKSYRLLGLWSCVKLEIPGTMFNPNKNIYTINLMGQDTASWCFISCYQLDYSASQGSQYLSQLSRPSDSSNSFSTKSPHSSTISP